MSRSRLPVRTVALVVAVLAVTVLTAGVVPAGTTSGTPGPDTAGKEARSLASQAMATASADPPYLSPPATTVSREEYTQPGIDISAAAAADAQRLRGHHTAAAFEQRVAVAENPSALVGSVIDSIGSRAEALDKQHGQLIAAYGAGELSTQRLLGELVRLEAAAAQHRRLASRVETVVDGSEELSAEQTVDKQGEMLADEILSLESPVTDRVVTGEFDAGATVYAQVGTGGVVLAVANSSHVERQATLRGQRNKSATNQFIENAGDENANALALERAEELYGEDNVRGFFPPAFDATTVYGVAGDISGGSFTAYLDGATRAVFHEQQTVTAAGVPVTETLTDSAGRAELTVNTTVSTGPMRVSVTDGNSPLGGVTVEVDNQTAGTTGAGGERLLVQPLGGATVSVTVGNEILRVTLP